MGAVAISALAGATIVANSQGSPFMEPFRPFVAGLTVFFWAVATWWIPLLFVLQLWCHLFAGIKISYSSAHWSMVFPLGMYTACTVHLGNMLELDFLIEVSSYFIYIALAAWTVTFMGLLKVISRNFCRG